MRERYIGLMSGTSADGVDAVLAEFESGQYAGLKGVYHLDFPSSLRERLLSLGRSESQALTVREFAQLDVAVGESFADAAMGLMRTVGIASADISAIGSHGQTIFHDPRIVRSSLQVGDANLIASRTGCTVVSDFRRADIALGGQGAPLVPGFHRAVFGSNETRTVVNIGGIANVTWLSAKPQEPVVGFDCGPGNGLMDEWAQRCLHKPYDEDGSFAASGSVVEGLLKSWLAERYFSAPAPKSTGRAQFNLDWAQAKSPVKWDKLSKADVAATLCELTAQTIVNARAPDTRRLLVCGGGARNGYLMDRLQTLLPGALVEPTTAFGLPPEWVEAAAFAWLARCRVNRIAGNLTSVTGARGPALLGAVYLPSVKL